MSRNSGLIRAILLAVVPIIAGEMVHGCNDRREIRLRATIDRERTNSINRELGKAQRDIAKLKDQEDL